MPLPALQRALTDESAANPDRLKWFRAILLGHVLLRSAVTLGTSDVTGAAHALFLQLLIVVCALHLQAHSSLLTPISRASRSLFGRRRLIETPRASSSRGTMCTPISAIRDEPG